MKIKNKGKVYPSPSSSSSSSPSAIYYSSDGDLLSVLKLLPAAILALVSVLAIEDRQVLAYMMIRSMKTSAPSFLTPAETKKKPSKKPPTGGSVIVHATPAFDCDCFDCYTSHWFRWDSSPNRELIHQAIEAFEDQLTNGEKSKRNSGKGKRKEKIGRRTLEKSVDVPTPLPTEALLPAVNDDEGFDVTVPTVLSNDGDRVAILNSETGVGGLEVEEREKPVDASGELREAEEDAVVTMIRSAPASNHKGLARKVLPDVLGLFNSRLWSLWGPN